jgi:UPF0271 protein
MASRSAEVAVAIASAARGFRVPLVGMSGSLQEEIYKAKGVGFIAEFYADLDYAKDGSLIITREHAAVEPKAAAERVLRAVKEGVVKSVDGPDVRVRVESVCVHSDTPGAVEVAKAVHECLADYLD